MVAAEPASVAVAAAHATLTEVLLHAARALREDADLKLRAAQAPGVPGGKSQGAKDGQSQGAKEGGQAGEGEGQGQGQGAPEGKSEEQKAEKAQEEKMAEKTEQPKPDMTEEQHKAEKARKAALERPLGLRLSLRDIGDLERMRDAAVLQSAPDITGWDAKGQPQPTQTNKELKNQGWKVQNSAHPRPRCVRETQSRPPAKARLHQRSCVTMSFLERYQGSK